MAFKGIDIRQTSDRLVFRTLLQDSTGDLLTTGTTTLKLYELQTDGTLKSYDFNDNTFKTSALTTETLAMTHRTGNNATTNTGLWTANQTTLTGFTAGNIYMAMVNNTGASPKDQHREFQFGSVEGDLTVNGSNNLDVNVTQLSDDALAADGLELFVEGLGTDDKVLLSTDAPQLHVMASIPTDIDLANSALYRLALILTDAIDNLPTTAEITPGTISIARKAIGGTAWSTVVNGAACSEAAGVIYYDEAFDAATGYAEGDSIRITWKSQKVVISGNDHQISDATGRFFYTSIRQTMRGTDGANTTTPPTVTAVADQVWDEARSGHTTAGTYGETFNAMAVSGTVTDASATVAEFDSSLAEATNDVYQGHLLVMTSGSAKHETAVVQRYNGGLGKLYFSWPLRTAPANGDEFVLIPWAHPRPQVAVETYVLGVTSQTQLMLHDAPGGDDAYNGMEVQIIDVDTDEVNYRVILDFDAATDTITIAACNFTVAANDIVLILGNAPPTTADVADAVLDELLSGHQTAGSVGAELHLVKAMLANKRTHTISTGVDQVMDDDGSTVLRTMTPTDGGDDTITVNPS